MNDGPFSLLNALSTVKGKDKPPIHLWHPEQVKEIDMEIRANGDWYHEGTIIRRQRLVHLFASVLRKEDERYYLVTPAEKCQIKVEDVPFQIVLMNVVGTDEDQVLSFTTNMAEEFCADADHPLRFVSLDDTPAPYVHVRDGLDGKLNRNVYYQLADLLTESICAEERWLGVWSSGIFFPVIRASEVG